MIKNFFILLLAFSFSFGAVSELVDPGSNQIIDLGYNKKSKDNKLTVPKEWVNSATLAKKIDSGRFGPLLVVLATRATVWRIWPIHRSATTKYLKHPFDLLKKRGIIPSPNRRMIACSDLYCNAKNSQQHALCSHTPDRRAQARDCTTARKEGKHGGQIHAGAFAPGHTRTR